MKILFVNPYQFGYTAGYFHYCKYLAGKGHIIDYICTDMGLPKILLEGINIKYFVQESKYLNWRINFIKQLKCIDFEMYDIIFLNQQKFSFLYRIAGVPFKAILDIRTGDLSQNSLKRKFWNFLIKIDSMFFKHVTILSKSLMILLRLSVNKCTILPLGADNISDTVKIYDYPRLLYVGTLHKRNIHNTIKAVSLFKEKFKETPITYDIVGFGSSKEESLLEESINVEGLSTIVKFHGRKNYNELKPFFDYCNIGLSYIPITPYFDCQPPTKTFEYILSGLFCIATNTSENRLLINRKNGLLCQDNSSALFDAILQFQNIRSNINDREIRESLFNYKWETIVSKILEPIFLKASKD